MTTSTTSARTQYVEHLRRTADDADLAWFKNKTDRRDREDVVNLAVTAQVLRDFITWNYGPDAPDSIPAVRNIKLFAARRGIDLGETP